VDSDEALFERFIAGDLAAFDRLYGRLERPLFGFVRAQLGDTEESEDVVHEAFVAVLRERNRRTEIRSFRAWIFQVAHNLCMNRVRTRKRAGKALEMVRQSGEPSESPAPDEHAFEHAERHAALLGAVARLPTALADVYRLRAAGMSYDEVSAVLSIPVGTVRSRMHEMVKRLREEMAR
jgi:RNA polymerase sigma-70 factor (ECF subfamily)